MFSKSKLFVSGQSLFEVILALAIFSLLAAAFVSLTLGSVSSVGYGTDFLTASTLADKGVGASRAIRDNAWNTLTDGVESAIFDSRFNRAITLSPVDLETKLLKTEVSWPSPVGVTQTVTRQTYLTNWDSRDWIQTDWSGGQYASVDPTIEIGVVGQISLKAKPAAWSLFVDTGNQTRNAIAMISATDGFVVGSAGLIWRLVSGTWSLSIDTGTETWNDIACSSSSNCWAVGNSGALAFFNGASWSESIIPSPANIFAIDALSASDIWAVGATGRLWHYNGSSWSAYSPSPSSQNLMGLFILMPSDGWSVGGSGNILHLTGGGYELSGLLTSSAFDMSDASPVQIIGWDETIPACSPACSVKFQIRVANDSAMTGAVWSPDFTVAAGTLINPSYNGKQYAQYQVQLTGDGNNTPTLNEVRINYK